MYQIEPIIYVIWAKYYNLKNFLEREKELWSGQTNSSGETVLVHIVLQRIVNDDIAIFTSSVFFYTKWAWSMY